MLGWLTGIVFLLLEKENKFVRFHAMQSTITFLGLTILSIILTPLAFLPYVGILVSLIDWLIMIIAIVAWILCIIKAYQGEKYKLPIVGDMAEKYV